MRSKTTTILYEDKTRLIFKLGVACPEVREERGREKDLKTLPLANIYKITSRLSKGKHATGMKKWSCNCFHGIKFALMG